MLLFSWSLTAVLFPPYPSDPQVTAEPSSLIATKDRLVANILTTPLLKSAATALLSPPWLSLPHVTTDPFSLSAAKAVEVEVISVTPLRS